MHKASPDAVGSDTAAKEPHAAGHLAAVDAPASATPSAIHPSTPESSSSLGTPASTPASAPPQSLPVLLTECRSTGLPAGPLPSPYVPATLPPQVLSHQWTSPAPQDTTHNLAGFVPPGYCAPTMSSGLHMLGSAAPPPVSWVASGFLVNAYASFPAMLSSMPIFGAPTFAMPLPPPYAACIPSLPAPPYGSAAAAGQSSAYGEAWIASSPGYTMPYVPPAGMPHTTLTWGGAPTGLTAAADAGATATPFNLARQPAVLPDGAATSNSRALQVLWRRACVRVRCVCEPRVSPLREAESDAGTSATSAGAAATSCESSPRRKSVSGSVSFQAGGSATSGEMVELRRCEAVASTPAALSELGASAAEGVVWRWLESLGMADAVVDLVSPDDAHVLVVWDAAREHRGAVSGAAAAASRESMWSSSLAGARLAQRLASGDCGILDVPREVVFDGVRLYLD